MIGKFAVFAGVPDRELGFRVALLEAFRQGTISNKDSGLVAENIAADLEYAKTRLRQELVTANFSSEAGAQVLLETDPQILKATESMAVARNMVEKNLAMRK